MFPVKAVRKRRDVSSEADKKVFAANISQLQVSLATFSCDTNNFQKQSFLIRYYSKQFSKAKLFSA